LKIRFFIYLLSLFLLALKGQVLAQTHKLIVLGNLTDISEESRFEQLENYIRNITGDHSILLAGDLLPIDWNAEDIERLRILLSHSKAEQIILLPGDRNWADSKPQGWVRVRALEKAIKEWRLDNIIWPLKKGCPGPKYIRIGQHSGLIVLNSQWFNHPYTKPAPRDGICKISTQGDFLEEFEDLMDENAGKNVLIAGHFPFYSLGPYGGHFPFTSWILPVPVISGLVTSYHQNVGRSTDIINKNYNDIRSKLNRLVLERHSVISISGHEKNTQIVKVKDNFLINSGNLSKESFGASGKNALLSSAKPGFVSLDLYEDGKINAKFISYSDSGFELSSTISILQSQCDVTQIADIPVNQNVSGCPDTSTPSRISKTYNNEQIIATAGSEYAASGIKNALWGKHYRDTWMQPVKVPVLSFDLYNGLTPFERGGGRQTKSLKFKAGNGYEYVFRSVDKDPARAVPFELRETFITNILRDQTTTQNPYGALAVDPLLNQLDILHAHPKLYVMPDANNLGPFRREFANMLGMIEERPTNPDHDNEKTFANANKIYKSFKMFNKLYDDHDNKVVLDEFLRARVFDLWVGDWGKHEDNWKWAGFRKNGKKDILFRPIPRDRDHVFSRWDGALPWLADREWAKSSGENFGYRIKDVKSLMWQARHLDRFLASEANHEGWNAATKYLEEHISKEDIAVAVRAMPGEVYGISGNEIEKKLESRLNDLNKYVNKYYSLLSKEVDVVGSSGKEYFIINGLPNGNVEVFMHNQDKKQMGSKILYSREFLPHETKEIRLFGLRNNDIFEITGEHRGKIKIRIIGGDGDDRVIDNSNDNKRGKSVLIYDKYGNNIIEGTSGIRNVKKADESAYSYDRTAFKYNTYLPKILASYNVDDGAILTAGISFTNHKYGKPDYSSIHKFDVDISTEGNFTFKYVANYRHVIGTWDLELGGMVGHPNRFNNFYGLGNETVKNQQLYNAGFYKTRYNTVLGEFGLINEFLKRSSFSARLGIEANGEQLVDDNFFSNSDEPIFGSEALDVIRGVFTLDLDFRDRVNLSTKGMRLYANHETGWVLNSDPQKRYHKFQTSIEQFISTRNEAALTLGLRVGGSTTWGDIPYYRRYYLGQEQNLRGFRKNRFTSDNAFFFNSDLRWMIAAVRTSFVPLGFGLRGFLDTGRVYERDVVSDKWYTGYGFGIFVVPLRESFAINISMAFSEEESGLLLISVGKTFN